VVLKSDGNAAYIAGDIAYVKDKFDRGHDLCIYMLGADHHGTSRVSKLLPKQWGTTPMVWKCSSANMVNFGARR